jgi:hypothetical protein
MATFRSLLDERICGARVVPNGDGTWRREYYSFGFPVVRPMRWDGKGAQPPEVKALEPDFGILDEVYRHALAPMLPPVRE